MKPARIILDPGERIELQWCWRDDWSSGFDSSFSLLMKFALLNQVPAKEIAKIFVSYDCGKRSVICGRPNVDLRDSSVFDRGVLASTLRISSDQMRAAFLLDLLPTSSLHSSEYLRWCPQCLLQGFHLSLFQIAATAYCPIHQSPLIANCHKCRAQIPYRLTSATFARPFCCPTCKADMAPSIRAKRTAAFIPRLSEKKFIEQLANYFQREEAALPRRTSLKLQRQIGRGDLIFSKPDEQGYLSRYVGFMTQVMAMQGHPRPQRQAPLTIERIERTVHGTSRHVLSADDEEEYGMSLSWPCDPGPLPAPRVPADLRSITQIYRSIRRHLWRRELRRHRSCIVAACRHLWWNVAGEVTPSFCPVADAFIRWRMMWEGCGTPRYLFGKKEGELHGIVGWISARPSPCPVYWSEDTRLWVLAHIFAATCIESFREKLVDGQRHQASGKQHWARHAPVVRYDTYWAVAGADTLNHPTTVYVRCPMPSFFLKPQDGDGKLHRLNHRAALSTICR
ncbi:MAG: hypothetical protein JWR40_1024 [Massilia sp.]|jgi:hypothetical protein|nr:hypothetical protein [Massilia sp.]MDB5950738.1 hypothetical protein [Massilia sp.]